MNIHFRKGSELISEKVITRSEAKLLKLSRLITERNYEALAYVDIERESGSNKSETLWRASVHLDHSGDHLNSSALGNTPEKATDLAIKDLKRELKDAHNQHRVLSRRQGSLYKRFQNEFA